MSVTYAKDVIQQIYAACNQSLFKPASKCYNVWLSSAKFAASVCSNPRSASAYYKSGSRIMLEVQKQFHGHRIDWMLMDDELPLVVYVGTLNQLEVKRDKFGNFKWRVVPSGVTK